MFRIIIVEDDAAHVEAIRRAIIDTGMNAHVDAVGSIRDYQRYLTVCTPDIALVDLNLPDGRAIDILTSPPEAGQFPVLIITGLGDEQTAVEAIKAGAIDYVVKTPGVFDEIPRLLVRALREWRLLTERKHAETALRESERKYRRLVENIGKEYFFYRRGINGVFTYVSPSVTAMLGYPVNEFMAPYEKYLTDNPINGDALKCAESALKGMPQQPYEAEFFHKDGSRRALEMSDVPVLDEQGIVVAVEGLAKDTTERKRFEQETRYAQTKLIHANKMSSLGMLVSSVAHEVNNPNNFIMFNSSLLIAAWNDIVRVLDEHAREDTAFRIAGLPYAEMREAVPRLLSGITDGSRRIKDMVDRLRELSREDRSGMTGAVDVNAAVRSALMILQNAIMKHTDAFSFELADPLPCVTGSPQQIEQVVINLVQNSLQALGSRKQAVTVRTFADAERHKVIIEVKDDGGGISANDLHRITEPFFTTKQDSGGTGLGLSISSAIVHDHQGTLDIQSEEGKGTTVRVVLPWQS